MNITLPASHVVTKGPRDKSWQATCEVDTSKLSPEIVMELAMHGLHQKIADAASSAKTQDEADAAMGKALDALYEGLWSRRGTGEGASDETKFKRSQMRAAIKAKLGAKSPEWAKFTGLADADQAEKLDALVSANATAMDAAWADELERRKAKAKLVSLSIDL